MKTLWRTSRTVWLVVFAATSISGCISPLVDEQLGAIERWNTNNAKAIAKLSAEQHTLVTEISNAMSRESFEARRNAALADIHEATFDRFQRCRLEVANQSARQSRTEREDRDGELDEEEQKRLRGVGDIAEEIRLLREQARSESRQISSRDLLQQVVDRRSLCIRNAHIRQVLQLDYPGMHCSTSAAGLPAGCPPAPSIPHIDKGRGIVENALHALAACLHDGKECNDLKEHRDDIADMTRALKYLSIEEDYREVLKHSTLLRDAIVEKRTGLHALRVAALNDLARISCTASPNGQGRDQYPSGLTTCLQALSNHMPCADKPNEEGKE